LLPFFSVKFKNGSQSRTLHTFLAPLEHVKWLGFYALKGLPKILKDFFW
jgi:hypothetical protein